MEAFELLREDHRQARSLLQRLRTGAGTRQDFTELKDVLDAHRQVEEEVFYPSLMHGEGMADHIKRALNDHAAMERQLAQMNAMGFGDETWTARLGDLERSVETHIRHEEEELLPRAEHMLSTRLREDIGARMQARREGLGEDSGTARERLGRRTEQQMSVWRGKAEEKGREFYYQKTEQAAEHVHGLAEALREAAQNLGQREEIIGSRYLEQAAGGLDRISDMVRRREPEEIAHDVMSFARRRPAIFLGTAAAAGFMLARFLKSSPPDQVPAGTGSTTWHQPTPREVH